MTDRDTITRTRARASGAVGQSPTMAVHYRVHGPTQCGITGVTTRCTKGAGKVSSDTPAFQPYWGKPAVRNDREDRGNVGIIRSPVRASILPDRSGHSRKLSAARQRRVVAQRTV